MNNLEQKKSEMATEIIALMDWGNSESEKVIANLKKKGTYLGLDGHREEFSYIREFERKRLAEIVKKYNLPPDTKLKLW